MDVVYLFRHSPHADEELRYSLRSVSRHAPWVRKVWVFGDRPVWLAADSDAVEHLPHDAVAWVERCKTPVVNTFLMLYLVALLPDLAPEFLFFCDDYVLLADLPIAAATRVRFLDDLAASADRRGTGLYKDALWRTYDLLKRLGYPTLNYEAHIPVHHTKRRILAAYRDLRDFVTEDRFYGPLANLAVLNHARRREGFTPVRLADEGTYAGFHFRPPEYEAIRAACAGRLFLNFDDAAFNDAMRRFLAESFPERCRYEAGGHWPSAGGISATRVATDEGVESPPTPPQGPLIGMPSEPPSADSPLGIPHRTAEAAAPPGRCVVLVPARGGIAPDCEAGLRELERRGYPVRRFAAHGAIDQARSRLASDALAEGYEETLWVDADLAFHADAVERLRAHRLPLCGCVYARKAQRAVSVQLLPGTTEIVFGAGGGLLEVLYSSFGFILVQRSTYEAVAAQARLAACTAPGGGPPLIPFFLPAIRPHPSGSWYLSPGYSFCHRARQAGIPVVVDTAIRLGHLGEAGYSWEEAGASPQRYSTYRFHLPPT